MAKLAVLTPSCFGFASLPFRRPCCLCSSLTVVARVLAFAALVVMGQTPAPLKSRSLLIPEKSLFSKLSRSSKVDTCSCKLQQTLISPHLGSIETKAVPYILTKFRDLYSQSSIFGSITSSDVLNGRLPHHFLELDEFLQSHCINQVRTKPSKQYSDTRVQNSYLDDNKVIKLLYDLSWWINELHGSDHGGHNDKWSQEPKTWSIFHGAINPTNIRICIQNNCTYLIGMLSQSNSQQHKLSRQLRNCLRFTQSANCK